MAPETPPKLQILQQWNLTPEEISEIVSENPSLRGIMFGYVAEYKARIMWFSSSEFRDLRKPDDHDRTKKGDFIFTRKGHAISVEVKSLQTATVRHESGTFVGKFQCDASDRRKITLPNRQTIETTCLLVGEFDLLAVNLFEFEKTWRFAFAKNSDLPRSKFRGYTNAQRKYLLATLMEVTWPVRPPFEAEPFRLLDEIVRERRL